MIEKFAIKKTNLKELEGGDASLNAKIALEILKGKSGPKKDIVLLNAGAAIYVADSAKTIEEGINKARESIDSGRALEKLESFKALTNR